jgi:hypothetical protein
MGLCVEGDWREGHPIVYPEPEPPKPRPNRARIGVPEEADEELRARGCRCVKVFKGAEQATIWLPGEEVNEEEMHKIRAVDTCFKLESEHWWFTRRNGEELPLYYLMQNGDEVERCDGTEEQWSAHLDVKLKADRLRNAERRRKIAKEELEAEKETIWRRARQKECVTETEKRRIRELIEEVIRKNPRQRYEMSIAARAHLDRLRPGRQKAQKRKWIECWMGANRWWQAYGEEDRVEQLTQRIAERTGRREERTRLFAGTEMLMREDKVAALGRHFQGKVIEATEWQKDAPWRPSARARSTGRARRRT